MAQTYKTYYEDEALWGKYQYFTMAEMITRIQRETTDQDSYLANIRRSKIVDVTKDGIRILAQEIKKFLKAVEITCPPSQYFPLPQDYVDWKRVSLVDENFRLNTLYQNNNIPTARGFLQDSNYDLIFNSPDESISEADASNMFNKPHVKENLKPTDDLIPGEFKIYEERGIIAFSPELIGQEYVMEYVSDGLDALNLDDATVWIHKMVMTPLRDYIYSECLWTRRGVPQSAKYGYRNRYLKSLHDARVASLDLDTYKLLTPAPSQTLRRSYNNQQ